jgi:hypothetical protein
MEKNICALHCTRRGGEMVKEKQREKMEVEKFKI